MTRFPYVRVLSILLLVCFYFCFPADMFGQCPMCKMSAESNLKDGGTMGKGLNMGILFLLSLPYLIVGTLGYLWYRNKKNYDESTE
ncbi:MAG: hypothetical protein IPL63_03720 [Saprospiraceae bacterium]|nr:hypothetical protein [Saprospiraceae bacterium]MBK8370570.1 hypothetical protein [Saprospiraceae bacterium]MBK8546511.1 hypothetical protein [Saprospiraceae bacterium]MBK8817632.1 hypothetical protein [Saprospiraceae bacterium]MBK8854577.1 hypothetical protein [Saprospiraceae bacterium]